MTWRCCAHVSGTLRWNHALQGRVWITSGTNHNKLSSYAIFSRLVMNAIAYRGIKSIQLRGGIHACHCMHFRCFSYWSIWKLFSEQSWRRLAVVDGVPSEAKPQPEQRHQQQPSEQVSEIFAGTLSSTLPVEMIFFSGQNLFTISFKKEKKKKNLIIYFLQGISTICNFSCGNDRLNIFISLGL